MEYDILLKNYLAKDNNILKIESKLSLDFLKCKIENCYSNKEINKITHQDYEECKRACLRESEKFNKLRVFIYEDFTRFYYKNFLECYNQKSDDKYYSCIEKNRSSMNKNIQDIKGMMNKFKFNDI